MLAVALSLAQPLVAAPTTTDPLVLGLPESGPIASGFLFLEGRYVDAPYVVSRRLVDIYINDKLVRKGRAGSAYDLRVNVDPGEPPSGSSPFDEEPPGTDSRDKYWSRKFRYLTQVSTAETFRGRVVELWKKCSKFKSVEADPADPEHIWVTDLEGNRTGCHVAYRKTFLQPPVVDDAFIKEAEASRAHFEKLLESGAVVQELPSGSEMIVSRESALAFLDAIAGPNAGKPSEGLKKAGLVKPGDTTFSSSFDERFECSPALRRRIEELRQRGAGANPQQRQPQATEGPKAPMRNQPPSTQPEKGVSTTQRRSTASPSPDK
ncbi:MAG: hypothetical protein NTW19_02705 [Planctomycetota bacterium]|nr:hypothetical protein [Planctomycetota bacterium]